MRSEPFPWQDLQLMRRLLPTGAPTEIADLDGAYALPADHAMPWVALSMVHSIDGSTSMHGVSGSLGSRADQAVFSTLRRRSDLLLVGARTAQVEGYRPVTRAGQRLAIVTGSGNLPWAQAVYRHPQTIIIAPEDGPPLPVPAVRAGLGRVDLREALLQLAPHVVLLEGGSSLNTQLLEADLVDEICVTTAPLTVLGSGPRIAFGPQEQEQRFVLSQVLEDDGYLFCRYLRLRADVGALG
jgi:riboflavin biosynthesis pyrimidine reductase